MNFHEIARQANNAQMKSELIDNLDLVLGIDVEYEITPDNSKVFKIERHSDLEKKIKELIKLELTKQNEQTKSNLKSWVGS